LRLAVDHEPALAPALALTGALPLAGGWTATATLDLSWSALERHDRGGPTVDLGGVTTLALAVGLERRLADRLRARAGLGGVKYFPADETGIFRLGGGGVFALGTVTLAYEPGARGLTWTGAGHEHLLLYRAVSRTVERIKSGGLVLGLREGFESLYKEHELPLDPAIPRAATERGDEHGKDRDRGLVPQLPEPRIEVVERPADAHRRPARAPRSG
jgi:hypothetical protein